MDAAVNSCKTYVAAAMDYINANAYAGTKLKIISNLYYPGYAADNVQSSCKDAATGATVNLQNTFLPRVATMNYWMCEFARQKGFQCADNFAQYMGADYDSNGDGQVDSDALRYVAGESEAALRRPASPRRCARRSATPTRTSCPPSSSYDYIQSDDTHPTYTGGTVNAGLFGGTTGIGRAALHRRSPTARTRSGTSTATSAWAGRCRPATRRRPDGRWPAPWTGPRPPGPTRADAGRRQAALATVAGLAR